MNGVLVGTVEATLLILLVTVLLGPIVAERFRVPGIVGLIFGGTLFGPYVLDWISAGGLVDDLGAIGILYLMFLAGISFDIRAFQENRTSAVAYGLLGFFIPFLLSAFVMMVAFGVGLLPAALVGAMWASNTLVAYPEIQTAGLQNNRAASAAVSAGVVADLLSLTVLAFVTSTTVIESDPLPAPFDGELFDLTDIDLSTFGFEPSTPDPTLPLLIALPVLVGFCLWVLPLIGERFFVRVGRSRMQRFVFALAAMSAGACVALIGGVEGLIGAFLAGLGLNRLVPNRGSLMERLEFVGTAVFVPTFLVSIGLNIDPALLIDRDTLLLGLVFTTFVIVGKCVAAGITGAIFGFTGNEIGMMSSLSFGQAASTLAIAQVGLSLGMFEQIIVNASVIAIVATALITSYGTRFFARRVPKPESGTRALGSNVLLDVRAPTDSIDAPIRLAEVIADGDNGLVSPFAITERDHRETALARVREVAAAVAARGLDSDGLVRIDDSFADGTVALVDEQEASLVVLAWDGPSFAADYLFGNDIDTIGETCPVPSMAVKVTRPWNRLVVAVGRTDTDWRREDADLAFDVGRRAAAAEALPLLLVVPDGAIADDLLGPIDRDEERIEVVVDAELSTSTLERLTDDDLVVAASHVLHELTPRAVWRLARDLALANVAVVGGPYRLSVSKGVTREPLRGALSRTASSAPS